MLVVLLLEEAPQVSTLHHLLYELIFETWPIHYANHVKRAPQIQKEE
jgi:hypothetical protein